MRSFAAGLLVVLLAGCASPEAGTPMAEAEVPADAVWAFTATDGNVYTSKTPERKVTVLFFMATWCSTCQSKAPALAEVAPEYKEKGVATYSIDFDATESREDLASWMDRYDQDWPHGIDAGLKMQRHYDVKVQSTVLVLDEDANVVKRFGYGAVTAAGLRAAIDEALGA